MQVKAIKGEKLNDVQIKWYHLFLVLTIIPAWIVLFLVTVLVFLVDLLLMDTHHIEFTIKPKKMVIPKDSL